MSLQAVALVRKQVEQTQAGVLVPPAELGSGSRSSSGGGSHLTDSADAKIEAASGPAAPASTDPPALLAAPEQGVGPAGPHALAPAAVQLSSSILGQQAGLGAEGVASPAGAVSPAQAEQGVAVSATGSATRAEQGALHVPAGPVISEELADLFKSFEDLQELLLGLERPQLAQSEQEGAQVRGQAGTSTAPPTECTAGQE